MGGVLVFKAMSYQEEENPEVVALMGRFDAIRIQRGAIISPAYQAEESEVIA
jgi:hypothetical protein